MRKTVALISDTVSTLLSAPRRWFILIHLFRTHLPPLMATFPLLLTTSPFEKSRTGWFDPNTRSRGPEGLPPSFPYLKRTFHLLWCSSARLRRARLMQSRDLQVEHHFLSILVGSAEKRSTKRFVELKSRIPTSATAVLRMPRILEPLFLF